MTQRNFRVRNGLTIDGTTSGSSSFASTATGTDLSYVLPGSAGASSTVLTNDGSGNLSWALPGGGGSTFGNVTVGVDTDQTISTTSGDLILDSASGTVSINVPTITTDATTLALFNTTATTINAFGAATAVSIGANTGTTTINNSLVADDISVTTVDTTNLEVINIKAKDGTAAASISNSTGIITVSTQLNVDNINLNTNTITTSTGNLILDSTSGTIILNSNGTLGVTLTPIAGQTPNAVFNGNMVKGVIRNATTEAGGAVWSYLAGGGAYFKGLSIDNSADTGRGSIAVLRAYGGSKASFISEVAAGTFATPTAITSGTLITELAGNGYNGTAFTGDNLSSNLPSVNISATQNWSDFVSTGSSISGTTLTIGTLVSGTVAAGQMIYGTGVTTATSIVSGSGSTWTVDKSQTIGPIQIQGGAQGTRLLVRAQSSGTRQSSIIGQGTAPLSIIDHQPTAATYIADAWTFRSRPVNTGGTNTTLLTLDATGNAVLTGDLAVNGGDITTTQTTATVFNTTATTLNVGQAATAVSLGATTGTATVRNALNVRSGISYSMLSTTAVAGGSGENNVVISKTDSGSSAALAIINFVTQRSTAGTYSPTLSGDILGQFKFNGNVSSTTTPSFGGGPAGSVLVSATENWAVGAIGSKIVFQATKNGTTAPADVISISPNSGTIKTDLLTINDSANVNLIGNNITYNRVYGQWQNLNTVTPAGSLTAYAFALPTQDFANIATVGSTSRIIPGAAGMYKLQFSVQVQNDDTADEHVAYLWWRKNGTDVPGSMGRVGVFKAKGAVNGLTIAGWDNMISSANTTDYWELMYAVDDATHVNFPAFAATAFGPATSSLFVTLVPVGA